MPNLPFVRSALSDLFETEGYSLADPPILQPADVFLDLAGEDIRRRLFLTTGTDGLELCLRPDFTIPVSRQYLERGIAGQFAAFHYAGPIFRQRPGHAGEIPQAGVELFGANDGEDADAGLLALALKAVSAAGLDNPEVRIGDEALFTAVLAALGLPSAWRRRLRDLFGDRPRLEEAVERMSGDGKPEENAGFLAALDGSDPDSAISVVEDLLSIAGISAVGGRSAHEIAERFLEQAALASGTGADEKTSELLKQFLDVNGPADQSVEALRSFETLAKIDLSPSISRFQRRLELLQGRGIELESLTFAADFGRRLDYYTGFTFEIHAGGAESQAPIVGGGRYDRLVKLLGAEEEVPAIGFSVWLDRLPGGNQ